LATERESTGCAILAAVEQVIMEISATMEGAAGLGQGKLRVTTERLVSSARRCSAALET
jgi:hypothetical protein